MTSEKQEIGVGGDDYKNEIKRGGFTKCMTIKTMGRGKFVEVMAQEVTMRPNILMSIECIAHHQKNNQTIPYCQKCSQHELWAPATNQTTTYSGDQFIN